MYVYIYASRIHLQLEGIMFMFWYLLPMALGSPASHATLRHDFSKSHKSTDREEREESEGTFSRCVSETRFCEIVNDSFKHRIFQKITQILFWQSQSLLGHVRPSKTLSLQLIVSRSEEKQALTCQYVWKSRYLYSLHLYVL